MKFQEIPAFVISCKGDEERRSATEKRFQEQGLAFTFFDASDGHHLPAEVFEAENIFLEHPGARGVTLSHMRLWRKMAEEDIPLMAIYEDDVIFHRQFLYFADVMWNMTAHRDSSISFMGYCCYHGGKGHREMKPGVHEFFPMALHAYIISRPVAIWFLENLGKVVESIDIQMQKVYQTLKPDFKSYVWWNGVFMELEQKSSRFNVYFNGFCYQDHDIQMSIHRDRN